MRAENARFRGDGKAKAPSLPAEHLSIGDGKGFYIDYTPPPLDILFKRDAALRGLTLDSGDHLMETLQLPDGGRVLWRTGAAVSRHANPFPGRRRTVAAGPGRLAESAGQVVGRVAEVLMVLRVYGPALRVQMLIGP